ncbi:MAG: zf-HC2 domain-containing protein [Planctomycetota bacterium]
MPPMPFRTDDDSDDYPGEALSREPSCRLVLELLPESLAGDLDETTTAVVDRHLTGCHACTREAQGLRAAREALLTLRGAEAEVEDGFFADLHRDILGEVRHRSRAGADRQALARGLEEVRGRGALLRFTGPVLQVASLAAALLVGLLIGRNGTPAEAGPGERLAGTEAPDDGMRPVGNQDGAEVRRLPRYDFEREQRLRVEELLRTMLMPRPVVPGEDADADAGLEAPETRGRDF